MWLPGNRSAQNRNYSEARPSNKCLELSNLLFVFRADVFTGGASSLKENEDILFRERLTIRSFWKVTAAAKARVFWRKLKVTLPAALLETLSRRTACGESFDQLQFVSAEIDIRGMGN